MSSKIALITGGSRGLGKSAALHLAASGMDIILTYKSAKDEADKVVKDIEAHGQKALALQLDVADSSSFAAFKQTLHSEMDQHFQSTQFHVLLNNAGMGYHTPFTEVKEAEFDALMNVHVKGVFFLTQALEPQIVDGGLILNVSSGLARFTVPGYCAYATMKGAIEVFTRYLAKELGPRGIRVNTIAPGATETDFGGGVVRDNKELNAMLATQTALGRVGLPDDIGGGIAALAQDNAAWITGQRIELSGGQSI
ncbi:3-oxoacyl-[acyl-carrier-protein] reductase FabG [Thalassocella blandensis]|nr:3-oxoacyl-[acyl-carrier-protein] reductase FabG [Thalassocella blandensis]